jgi:hypothetical protein
MKISTDKYIIHSNEGVIEFYIKEPEREYWNKDVLYRGIVMNDVFAEKLIGDLQASVERAKRDNGSQ